MCLYTVRACNLKLGKVSVDIFIGFKNQNCMFILNKIINKHCSLVTRCSS